MILEECDVPNLREPMLSEKFYTMAYNRAFKKYHPKHMLLPWNI